MALGTSLLRDDPPRLGAYTLTARLGEGGQGVVYLAVSPSGGQVAIKLLKARLSQDARARSRFARELSATERVSRFCTAAILDSDMDGDRPYIVSEFVPGPALHELPQRLSEPDLLRLATGTATALAAIHQAGVVHRDFKPANVIMAPDGPRVIDFGIARLLDSDVTVTSQIVGTPAYMAPEQLAGGPIGPAADMFAWGLTMIYAATGRRAFGGDSVPSVMNAILHGTPDLGGLPPWLTGLVTACLDKDPARRPTAVQALLHLLAAPPGAHRGDVTTLLTQGAAASRGAGAPFRATPPGLRWLALGGVLLMMIAAGLEQSFMSVTVPAMVAALHASVSHVAWAFTGYIIGQALAIVPASRLADQIGRKVVFLIGAAGLILTSALIPFAPSLGLIIALRGVQGIAVGLALPAGLAVFRESFSGTRLAVAVGLVGLAIGGPPIGGAIVAAPIIDATGWRLLLLLPALVGVVALVLVLVAARESRGDAAASFSAAGVLLLTAALGLLAYAVVRIGDRGLSGVVGIVLVVVALGLVAAFWLVETGARNGRLPALFSAASMPAAIGVTVVGFAALFGVTMLTSEYLQINGGMSPWATAVHLLPMTLAFLVATVPAGVVAGLAGPRPVLLAGLLLTTAAAFGLSRIGATVSYATMWPWLPVAGIGLALTIAGATLALFGHAPPGLAGAAGGLQQAGQVVGAALGTSILYGLALPAGANGYRDFGRQLADGAHTQLAVTGGMTLVAAVLALSVRRPEA